MTKVFTTWNWKTDPDAALRWTEPERRVVLAEPDLWEGEVHVEHLTGFRMVSSLATRGAVVLLPTRDPASIVRPFAVALAPLVPTLVARTQPELEAGVADLLAVPAAHRALLVEPREAIALGVDPRSTRPRGVLGCPRCHGFCQVRVAGYDREGFPREDACPACDGSGFAISWVIVRGGDAPPHPAWVRALRDQCAVAGAPFAFLGWGEWVPDAFAPPQVNGFSRRRQEWFAGGEQGPMPTRAVGENIWWKDGTITGWGTLRADGTYWDQTTPWTGERGDAEFSVYRVGAARSGRTLDGREHLDSPWGPLEVAATEPAVCWGPGPCRGDDCINHHVVPREDP